jgi:hypothetical protein
MLLDAGAALAANNPAHRGAFAAKAAPAPKSIDQNLLLTLVYR